MAATFYDVTTFQGSISPYQDIGTVINEIIADIKATQTAQTTRPGAVIYVPPGHYDLLTRVVIDISFLQIKVVMVLCPRLSGMILRIRASGMRFCLAAVTSA